MITEGGLFALGVLAGVDIGEDFGPSIRGVDEAALKHFGLKGAHERFGLGVVIGGCPSRHALAHSCPAQALPLGTTAILATAINVDDWLLSGAA